jgi:hypothetical protein
MTQSPSEASYSDVIGSLDEALGRIERVIALVNTPGIGLNAAFSLRTGGPGGRTLDGAHEDLVCARAHLARCREWQREEDRPRKRNVAKR